MNIKTMSVSELRQRKTEMEKQFEGFREYLNSLNIKGLLPKEGIQIPKEETLTNQDILEAIKRIANKTEVK